MKKLFIALSIVMITLLCGISAFAADTDDSGMWEYESYGSGVELTKYNGTQTDVYVPSKIEEGGSALTVAKLGDELFKNNTALNSATLGEGITEIGNSVFEGATNLVTVVTPESLTTIGDNAFAGCINFNSVILYNGVTSIGENAFAGCDDLLVYCNRGTEGYKYMIENTIEYRILNTNDIPETYIVDGVTYYLSNGTATVMKMDVYDRKIIPAYIKGVPVVRVNENAVNKKVNGFIEVQLPDSIVKFPNGLGNAIYWCTEGSSTHQYLESNHYKYILIDYGTEPEVFEDDIFTYYIVNKKYAILKSCSKEASGKIVVPDTVEGFPVKYVYSEAFYD